MHTTEGPGPVARRASLHCQATAHPEAMAPVSTSAPGQCSPCRAPFPLPDISICPSSWRLRKGFVQLSSADAGIFVVFFEVLDHDVEVGGQGRTGYAVLLEDRRGLGGFVFDEIEAVFERVVWDARQERGDLSQATAHLQALATDTRQTEPIDMNLFEQAPRRLAHYGYALARQGSYEEGAAVFERLAALYPDSLLADKWRDDAAHLREVINRVTR